MQSTVFTPVQLKLLHLFSTIHGEAEEREVQELLLQYYFSKIEHMTAALAKEKGWTPQQLEAMSNEHLRTPYK